MIDSTKCNSNTNTNENDTKINDPRLNDDNFDESGMYIPDLNDEEIDIRKTNDEINNPVQIDRYGLWCGLVLLSTTLKVLTRLSLTNGMAMHNNFLITFLKKKMQTILSLLNDVPIVFYHSNLRFRCFETFCDCCQFLKLIEKQESHNLEETSQILTNKMLRFILSILDESNNCNNNKHNSFDTNGDLIEMIICFIYRILCISRNNVKNKNAGGKHSHNILKHMYSLLFLQNNGINNCKLNKETKLNVINIIVLLNGFNENKCNDFMTEIVFSLHYCLRKLVDNKLIASCTNYRKQNNSNSNSNSNSKINEIDKSKCLSFIVEYVSNYDLLSNDTFDKLLFFENIILNLIVLLNYLLKRQNPSSSNGNGSNSSNSESMSLNGIFIEFPLRNIFLFLMDVSCIELHSLGGFNRSSNIEYSSFYQSLLSHSLWLLCVIIHTFGQSLLPYSNSISFIIKSINVQTRQLSNCRFYFVWFFGYSDGMYLLCGLIVLFFLFSMVMKNCT